MCDVYMWWYICNIYILAYDCHLLIVYINILSQSIIFDGSNRFMECENKKKNITKYLHDRNYNKKK